MMRQLVQKRESWLGMVNHGTNHENWQGRKHAVWTEVEILGCIFFLYPKSWAFRASTIRGVRFSTHNRWCWDVAGLHVTSFCCIWPIRDDCTLFDTAVECPEFRAWQSNQKCQQKIGSTLLPYLKEKRNKIDGHSKDIQLPCWRQC